MLRYVTHEASEVLDPSEVRVPIQEIDRVVDVQTTEVKRIATLSLVVEEREDVERDAELTLNFLERIELHRIRESDPNRTRESVRRTSMDDRRALDSADLALQRGSHSRSNASLGCER